MFRSIRFVLPLALIIAFAAKFPSQERSTDFKEVAVKGSLAELRDKRKVWLIVRRSALLDVSGAEASIMAEVYKEGNARTTFPRTYNLIAKKLNKYMHEHQSISAAQSLRDAEFVIFFNVLEIRRPLGTPYAYGELFVILNERSNPRIIWKTRKNGMFVDNAIDAMLSDLKDARGER